MIMGFNKVLYCSWEYLKLNYLYQFFHILYYIHIVHLKKKKPYAKCVKNVITRAPKNLLELKTNEVIGEDVEYRLNIYNIFIKDDIALNTSLWMLVGRVSWRPTLYAPQLGGRKWVDFMDDGVMDGDENYTYHLIRALWILNCIIPILAYLAPPHPNPLRFSFVLYLLISII